MEIITLNTLSELEEGFKVLKELRTQLTFDSFMTIYKAAQQADEYTLVALLENNHYVAVMGYRILHDYVHGKHLYIDDLAVTTNQQSKGLGKMLLSYAEDMAKQKGCQGLRLCTGKENERGIKFYEREGWIARALAFKKAV